MPDVTPTELYAAWDRFHLAASAALSREAALYPMLEKCPSWTAFQNGYVSIDQILAELVLGQDWPDRPMGG